VYEGALPKTGIALGAGGAGALSGLSWLLAIGLTLVVGGILLARYVGSRDQA